MKTRNVGLVVLLLFATLSGSGQSMHFSQFYNAPMLLNPANTALMPDYDFRVGLNYRNQWSAVPVPYNTFSAFGDFKVGGNSNNDNHNNWLGLGMAFFNDVAGSGNLSLNEFQGDAAYHLQVSRAILVSLGFSGAICQRSVDFSNFTFDSQWDGLSFNSNISNNEKQGVVKASYYTVGAGFNIAYIPSDVMYVKFGGSIENLNQPNESFYNEKNTLEYRPVGNIDMLYKTGPVLIINPSVYFATQSGASELIFGSQFRTLLTDKYATPAQLILGAYCRLGDAVIGVAGMQVGPVQFTASYDFTVSALSPYDASYGALEFSLIYQRQYHPEQGIKKTFVCPRFF